MTQPNILIFMPDQMHHECVGPGGLCQTPNLDALAERGTTFSHAFTPTPICSPARASTITGLLPHQHKLLHNTHMDYPIQEDLPEGTRTFADELAAAGYETFLAGKWHIGKNKGPSDHGFNETGTPATWRRDPERFKNPIEIPNRYEQKNILAAATSESFEETQPGQIGQTTADFIRRNAETGKPFCAFVSTDPPHVPWITPESYVARYDADQLAPWPNYEDNLEDKPAVYRKHYNGWDHCRIPGNWPLVARALTHYFGIISVIDQAFGLMVEALRETGQLENTLIIVTSDHGEHMGRHGLFGKNEMLTEDLVRIPLIVSWPERFEGSTKRDETVTLCDFYPTLIEAAGLQKNSSLPGCSMVPLLGNEPAPSGWPKEVLLEHHGDLQYNVVRGIRDNRYKYVYWANDFDEFYDLENDPWEQQNLAADPQHKGLLDEYQQRLLKQMETTGDGFLRGVRSNMGNKLRH